MSLNKIFAYSRPKTFTRYLNIKTITIHVRHVCLPVPLSVADYQCLISWTEFHFVLVCCTVKYTLSCFSFTNMNARAVVFCVIHHVVQ